MARRLFVLLLLAGLASPVGAQQVKELGAHSTTLDDFNQVLASKCTICHSRERIEVAMREHRDLALIEAQMIKRGATLTEADKSVLGTFWGSPLKKNP